MPRIPDFTAPAWQAGRPDAELISSILDGKGASMPPAGDDVTEADARGLVAYVRAFAPAVATENPGENEHQASTGASESRPPTSFLQKLVRWTGNFHPPVVHFPIALITAAAVAEVLRMITGNPTFNSISRYCLWFGSLTGAVAGVLGWFLGGFHLLDDSRVMTIHRWLGTSTVMLAALTLILSEASRNPQRQRTRGWSRVAMLLLTGLVSVTGYFGGAAVFGLDHYNWPR
jgi:uncharacterized membrane protein